MGFLEVLLLGMALSMDACAVGMTNGMTDTKMPLKRVLLIALFFGFFQFLMPLIGYFVGTAFASYVTAVDHWIALVLLCGIGGNMIKESFEKEENDNNDNYGFKTMLIMAIATSIDALAAGISLAMDLNGNNTYAFIAVAFIGVITFTLSALGVKIGNIYGAKFKSKAEFMGGLILIILGIKILLEHLGVINF